MQVNGRWNSFGPTGNKDDCIRLNYIFVPEIFVLTSAVDEKDSSQWKFAIEQSGNSVFTIHAVHADRLRYLLMILQAFETDNVCIPMYFE